MFHSVDNSHFEGKGVNTNQRSHPEQQQQQNPTALRFLWHFSTWLFKEGEVVFQRHLTQ